MRWPPISTSFVTVRRKWITGVAHRTISSMAVGATPSKSASHLRRSSGKSVSAFMPWLIAFRVVSFPATTSRMKKDANSAGVSRSPSTSACMRTLVMSSPGLAMRASPSACAYCDNSTAAFMRTSIVTPYSGSPMPRITFESSNIRRLSASGMPIMSQMIASGSGPAISSTKSQVPLGATVRTMRRAVERTVSSSEATTRGVKPRFTSFRSFVCRGASMLIMEPKNSSSSTGRSPMFDPRPELNVSESRDARSTSS